VDKFLSVFKQQQLFYHKRLKPVNILFLLNEKLSSIKRAINGKLYFI